MEILKCKTCGRIELEVMIKHQLPANPMGRHVIFKHRDVSMTGWITLHSDRYETNDSLKKMNTGVPHKEGIL